MLESRVAERNDLVSELSAPVIDGRGSAENNAIPCRGGGVRGVSCKSAQGGAWHADVVCGFTQSGRYCGCYCLYGAVFSIEARNSAGSCKKNPRLDTITQWLCLKSSAARRHGWRISRLCVRIATE